MSVSNSLPVEPVDHSLTVAQHMLAHQEKNQCDPVQIACQIMQESQFEIALSFTSLYLTRIGRPINVLKIHALALFAMGHYEQAANIAQEILTHNPNHVHAKRIRNDATAVLENLQALEAIPYWEDILEGMVFLRLGSPNKTIEALKTRRGEPYSDTTSLHLQTEAWINLGDLDMAAKIIDCLPDSPHKLELEEKLIDAGLTKNPNYVPFLLMKADLLFKRQEHTALFELIDRIQRIDPDNQKAVELGTASIEARLETSD